MFIFKRVSDMLVVLEVTIVVKCRACAWGDDLLTTIKVVIIIIKVTTLGIIST